MSEIAAKIAATTAMGAMLPGLMLLGLLTRPRRHRHRSRILRRSARQHTISSWKREQAFYWIDRRVT